MFVLRKGYVVVSAAPEGGGRIVHERTGDSLELSPDDAHALVRAAISGIEGDDPEQRSLVRRFSDLGLLVPRPEAPAHAPAPASASAPAARQAAFRSDLTVKQRDQSAVFDVTNPDTTRTFQLYDFELNLARMLDGLRTPEQIVAAARAKGIPVTAESMASFTRQLDRYGFLEKTANAEAAVAAPAPAPHATGADNFNELALEDAPGDFDLPTVEDPVRPATAKPEQELPSVAPAVAPLSPPPEDEVVLPTVDAPAPVEAAAAKQNLAPPALGPPAEPAPSVAPPSIEVAPAVPAKGEPAAPATWYDSIASEAPPVDLTPTPEPAPATPAPEVAAPALAAEPVVAPELEPVPQSSSELQISEETPIPPPAEPLEAPRPFSVPMPLGSMPPAEAPSTGPTPAPIHAVARQPAASDQAETVQRPMVIPPQAKPPEAHKSSSSGALLRVGIGLGALALGIAAYFMVKPPPPPAGPAPAPIARTPEPPVPPRPDPLPPPVAEVDAGAATGAEVIVQAPNVTVDAGVAVAEVAPPPETQRPDPKPEPEPVPEPGKAPSGDWAEFKVVKMGRVRVAEVVAPFAGAVKWKARPEQLVKRGETVATMTSTEGNEVKLTAKQEGLVVLSPGLGATAAANEALAGILYFEAFLIADVSNVRPEAGWRCEVESKASAQKANCKVVQTVKKGGGLQTTSTAEPRWIDEAKDLTIRFAPP